MTLFIVLNSANFTMKIVLGLCWVASFHGCLFGKIIEIIIVHWTVNLRKTGTV